MEHPQQPTYHYTLYDELRGLPNGLAIIVFMVFNVFNILVSSAAGPVAVTVGLRMSHFSELTATQRHHYLLVGLAVAALRTGIVTLLALVNKGVRLDKFIAKAFRGEEHEKKLPRIYVYRGGDVVCGGLSDMLYLVVSQLTVACFAIAVVLGAFAALGGGLAAFAFDRLEGYAPNWIMYCGFATGIFVFVDAPQSFGLTGLASIATATASFAVQYAIAGVVFARVAKIQGHDICPYRVAAAAGAAFGATLVAGRFPVLLLDFLSGCGLGEETNEPREPQGCLAEKLFLAPASERAKDDVERLEQYKQFRAREHDAAIELGVERGQELRKHPEMTKVFWSRSVGLDKVSHYVLIVGNHKYELRDLTRQRHNANIAYYTAPYVAPTDRSLFRRYDVYLIGWTNLNHGQVDAICRRHAEGWQYSILKAVFGHRGGNCQHFLRVVADEIVADEAHQAMAWDWFRHDRMAVAQRWELASLRVDQRMEWTQDHWFGG